jgi:hypothetical protein
LNVVGNILQTGEQKRIIENEKQELRTKINNHLDKLQENLMKELTEEETKISRNSTDIRLSYNKIEIVCCALGKID